MQKVGETAYGQVHIKYDMLLILGGLLAALFLQYDRHTMKISPIMGSEVNQMQKKEIYVQLQNCLSDYKKQHNRTADLDFMIARQFASGKTAIQIAMEIPCGEATVYRAIRRITNFLKYENMPCQTAGHQVAEKKENA